MAQLDHYLPCEAYANRPVAEGHEGFTQFQDETSGLYYFAMVDKNGHVVLKSEGHETPESRDNGIQSVMHNRDIEERWVKSKDDRGYYLSLQMANHQEVARTCAFDSEGALLGWWLPFAAGAYAWGRSEVEKAVPAAVVSERIAAAPPVLPPPVVLSVKRETTAPPPPPPSAESRKVVPDAAGGSNGWKYLLPIAALIGLLWLLLRGCGG